MDADARSRRGAGGGPAYPPAMGFFVVWRSHDTPFGNAFVSAAEGLGVVRMSYPQAQLTAGVWPATMAPAFVAGSTEAILWLRDRQWEWKGISLPARYPPGDAGRELIGVMARRLDCGSGFDDNASR